MIIGHLKYDYYILYLKISYDFQVGFNVHIIFLGESDVIGYICIIYLRYILDISWIYNVIPLYYSLGFIYLLYYHHSLRKYCYMLL